MEVKIMHLNRFQNICNWRGIQNRCLSEVNETDKNYSYFK